MDTNKHVLGFWHFRTDLGDGMRTGIYFDSCDGKCKNYCMPPRFLNEHAFGEDSLEKGVYRAEELIDYLLEEKTLCFSKRLGISFLGREPLSDSWYCLQVAEALAKANMPLHIWSCGTCPLSSFDLLRPVTELFVINFFSPVTGRHRPFRSFTSDRVRSVLHHLDSGHFRYRIRVPVLPGVNEDSAEAISYCLSTLNHTKSIFLDFSASSLTEDEVAEYRYAFRKRDLILY